MIITIMEIREQGVKLDPEDDIFEGTRVRFTGKELSGIGVLVGYDPAQFRTAAAAGKTFDVILDFISMSEFECSHTKVRESITALEQDGDYRVRCNVVNVDPTGQGIVCQAGSALFMISQRVVPASRWEHCKCGDGLLFVGHQLLLWI